MQRRSRRRRSRGHQPNYQRLRKRTTQQLVMTVIVLAGLLIFSHEVATTTAGCFGTLGQGSESDSGQEKGHDAPSKADGATADPQPEFRLKIDRVKTEK